MLSKHVCTYYSPPVPVGLDAQGRQIPGEVPKLFGGDIVEYIMVRPTGLVCEQSIQLQQMNFVWYARFDLYLLFYRQLVVKSLSLSGAASRP